MTDPVPLPHSPVEYDLITKVLMAGERMPKTSIATKYTASSNTGVREDRRRPSRVP